MACEVAEPRGADVPFGQNGPVRPVCNGLARPHKPGNTHLVAVKYLNSAYLGGGSGYGGDHTCDSAGNLDMNNLGYGEISVSGMEALYSALKIVSGDVFYDLGSGTGKLVLYVALRGEVASSSGLEVGERRHRLAEAACEKLRRELLRQAEGQGAIQSSSEDLPALDSAVSSFCSVNGDVRKCLYNDATVAVVCNLCMDQHVQNRAVKNLVECPAIRRIASTAPLPQHPRLSHDGTVPVCCTWAKVTKWHLYNVLPARSRVQPGSTALQRGRSSVCAAGPGRILPRAGCVPASLSVDSGAPRGNPPRSISSNSLRAASGGPVRTVAHPRQSARIVRNPTAILQKLADDK